MIYRPAIFSGLVAEYLCSQPGVIGTTLYAGVSL